jgi:energy-coupling factor transporter ATP-binding protein EcfA2
MAQDIARVYQQCDPTQPLAYNDPRYVPFTGTRGEGDLVAQITNALFWSETPHHILFAGHRGGGKSTELLRLQHALTHPAPGDQPFFVVYFEADKEDIDVNDVDFPDLLLAILRQVGEALRMRVAVELCPTWLSRFIDDLQRLFTSEVEMQQVQLDVKIAKFTAAIKSSPDMRSTVRKALEPNVSNLIQAANELIEDAVTRLRLRGYRDLVLIVDNLDRVILRDIPDTPFNTHEHLFINRGTQLAQLRCHSVYTVPISLVFSPQGTALINVFSRRPDVLPMVKVAQSDDTDSAAGLEAMRQMVHRRLEAAQVSDRMAFDTDETLADLCRMSGGHARNLLILLRSACTVAGTLPLTRAVVEQAVHGMSNDFERALNRPEFFQTLR